MKKLFLSMFLLGLVAAGCNSQKAENTTSETTAPQPSTTTPTQNNNLKSYTNAKYNFTFNYPKNYTLTEKDVTEESANFSDQKVVNTKTAYDIELKSVDGKRISFQVNWTYGGVPTSTDKTVKENKNGIAITKYYLTDIQGDLGKFINTTFTVKGNNYLVQAFNSSATETDLNAVLNSLKFN